MAVQIGHEGMQNMLVLIAYILLLQPSRLFICEHYH